MQQHSNASPSMFLAITLFLFRMWLFFENDLTSPLISF
jgi:hypothetical protein